MNPEERYSRQVLFPPIGHEGQRRLADSRVAILGCGATGSAVVSLLARAGVGTLRIIDRDYVEPSNLQRQTLFDEADAGASLPKAIAAAQKIRSFNSQIAVEAEVADVTPENIERLLAGTQIVLDGTDNFETRYLLNDFSIHAGVPWIYAAAVASYGATMNIVPGETACLACVFPEAPRGDLNTCDTAGVLNSVVSLIASIAATEAIKLRIGAGDKLRRTLLSFDVWSNQQSEINTATSRSDCRVCAKREFIHLAGKSHPHVTLCGRNSVQIHERERPVNFAAMTERLRPHGTVRHNDFVLKFWPEPYEVTLFPDGRAIIKGTSDSSVARGLYAKFFGN